MRLRNKPWAQEYIQAHPEVVIANPEARKGKWHEEFGNSNPVHVEVGTGKGQFVIGMAQQNPHINYIGIELYDSVIVVALEKVLEQEALPNLRLLNVNGKDLTEYFEKGDIHQVYLNFSDPWPKTRHAKRRLTHANFLTLYRDLMPEGGEVHFKTDNRGLFEYSLISTTDFGMQLKLVSLDLHAEEPEENVRTEYEEKFAAKGQPIYRLEAKFK
ncbi:tRNA (guanosine(46)-N7)-methyltransferase TrmB [Chryseomicrobium palamuruense]|uniref:tRNA (guanine-N(7)-)-methyltransferase n=1 Tax=Chryseomicrobium palamuruense TaxID=682973 RepID=A0ABV8UXD6_9BACL